MRDHYVSIVQELSKLFSFASNMYATKLYPIQ